MVQEKLICQLLDIGQALHFRKLLHVLRRETTSSQPLIFTKYEGVGQTDLYAKELRFSTSMFDDHMPWGYNSLFAGTDEMQKCTLEKFLEKKEHKVSNGCSSSLQKKVY